MNNELMLQELSDSDLELVNGGHRPHHHGHGGHCGHGQQPVIKIFVFNNANITYVQNNYEIVYAPVYINGTVTNSNIDNGNSYVQGSHILTSGSH